MFLLESLQVASIGMLILLALFFYFRFILKLLEIGK